MNLLEKLIKQYCSKGSKIKEIEYKLYDLLIPHCKDTTAYIDVFGIKRYKCKH